MLLTQTLLSFKLNFDMIVECARSTCLTPSFACVSGVVYINERVEKLTFEFGESGRWEIRLKDDEYNTH